MDLVGGDEGPDRGQRADQLDPRGVQADLLLGLAQRGVAQVLVGVSWRPPGNEISPAWRRRSARRSVKTSPGSPDTEERHQHRRVGAPVRIDASAASSGVSRARLSEPASSSTRRSIALGGERLGISGAPERPTSAAAGPSGLQRSRPPDRAGGESSSATTMAATAMPRALSPGCALRVSAVSVARGAGVGKEPARATGPKPGPCREGTGARLHPFPAGEGFAQPRQWPRPVWGDRAAGGLDAIR